MSDAQAAVDEAKKNILDCLREIEDEIHKIREMHGEGISFKIWMKQDEHPGDFESEKVEKAFIWLNTDRTDQLMGIAARMDV